MREEYYEDGVVRERELVGDRTVESFLTPVGEILMERKCNPVSFFWDIVKLMVENMEDLKILLYAMERKKFLLRYENWEMMEQIGGDVSLGFPSIGFTALGQYFVHGV